MTNTQQTPDVVGYPAIADRTGVTENAVRKWTERYDDFPKPAGHLSRVQRGPGSSPWWLWSDVVEFLKAHPNLGRVE